MSEQKTIKHNAVAEHLNVPWLGLRPDLKLYPGPIDHDGQRSWILEDPVRGNNFRLGYTEGEILFRLMREKDPDAALLNLYKTTPLRPSVEEFSVFLTMLQRQTLAIIPPETAILMDKKGPDPEDVPFLKKLIQGTIFFRVPLIRPDGFLTKTLPWVSLLWSPPLKWLYFLCSITGLILTIQEIELYIGTVSYLFTPRGWIAFALCLSALKIGHEFAHAYTAKYMGLHIRSMGIFFIVLWPLLYTDTTDAWKISSRKRRMWIAGAGVTFELVVAGVALLFWAVLPDGILRSLMFFLSGTSLATSFLINLNPFMRYDGYYILMDYWGIDNLRQRAFAMLRHAVLRVLFRWKAPLPETHSNTKGLIIYGFLALLYRLFIGFTIAIAVYFLLHPLLGLAVAIVDIWLFLVYPLIVEIRHIVWNRQFIGSRNRSMITCITGITFFALLFFPLSFTESLPGLILKTGTNPISAPSAGMLLNSPPTAGKDVRRGELLIRIGNDELVREARNIGFDLEIVRKRIRNMGSGGKQGAYRKWLLAEEERLAASLDKVSQGIAQLEIRAPVSGRVLDVNRDIYKGCFLSEGEWICTIAIPDRWELKAYAPESIARDAEIVRGEFSEVRIPGFPKFLAVFREKSAFPAYTIPNESLFDYAGGPIVSSGNIGDKRPGRARFSYSFEIPDVPFPFPHGVPCSVWIKTKHRSVFGFVFSEIRKSLAQRGY